MRITLGIAAMASLGMLAGCNGGAANNSAGAPAANASAPAGTSAPVNVASPERRVRQIRECVRGASSQLPQGTDANAFCSCAVDKMLTNGTAQRDAVIECAGEMHIQMQEG